MGLLGFSFSERSLTTCCRNLIAAGQLLTFPGCSWKSLTLMMKRFNRNMRTSMIMHHSNFAVWFQFMDTLAPKMLTHCYFSVFVIDSSIEKLLASTLSKVLNSTRRSHVQSLQFSIIINPNSELQDKLARKTVAGARCME